MRVAAGLETSSHPVLFMLLPASSGAAYNPVIQIILTFPKKKEVWYPQNKTRLTEVNVSQLADDVVFFFLISTSGSAQPGMRAGKDSNQALTDAD